MTLKKLLHNFNGHLHTVNAHRRLVRKYCFKLGIYRQGLMHDLSKYSPSEFIPGVKYYQDGHRSPNNAQREDEGVSKAWLHHKGRNKHHFEYWIDYDVDGSRTVLAGMKMPVKYVVEMFCDRIAASRIYNKENIRIQTLWIIILKDLDIILCIRKQMRFFISSYRCLQTKVKSIHLNI